MRQLRKKFTGGIEMRKKNKEFYVWTVRECIKDMYENWGTDMMSMYSYIQIHEFL